MNLLSDCCKAGIVKGTAWDFFPLGHKEYNGRGLAYQINQCTECHKECDVLEGCDSCGEVGKLHNTIFGDWCMSCIHDYSEKERINSEKEYTDMDRVDDFMGGYTPDDEKDGWPKGWEAWGEKAK